MRHQVGVVDGQGLEAQGQTTSKSLRFLHRFCPGNCFLCPGYLDMMVDVVDILPIKLINGILHLHHAGSTESYP